MSKVFGIGDGITNLACKKSMYRHYSEDSSHQDPNRNLKFRVLKPISICNLFVNETAKTNSSK